MSEHVETVESKDVALKPGERLESFLRGRIKVVQQQVGYRFSIDPILLTGFVEIKPDDRVIDLGSGSGVMPLILACRGQGSKFVGVEIQQALVDQSRRSVQINGFADSIEIVHGDYMRIRELFDSASFDVVISNPPYVRRGAGRVPSDEQRAIARHEISMDLGGMIAAAAYVLKPGGRGCLVYPTNRMVDLLQICRQHDLEPKSMQLVYTNESTGAKLLLLEVVSGGGPELEVLKPLFVYNLEGDFTDEVNGIMEHEPRL